MKKVEEFKKILIEKSKENKEKDYNKILDVIKFRVLEGKNYAEYDLHLNKAIVSLLRKDGFIVVRGVRDNHKFTRVYVMKPKENIFQKVYRLLFQN